LFKSKIEELTNAVLALREKDLQFLWSDIVGDCTSWCIAVTKASRHCHTTWMRPLFVRFSTIPFLDRDTLYKTIDSGKINPLAFSPDGRLLASALEGLLSIEK
jgi:hypothetical protein